MFLETPKVAAADTPLTGANSKTCKPITADFRKQLKCCDEETEMIIQAMPVSSNTDDHSMANGSAAVLPGIAGILEGFGLLDYQADTPPVLAENAKAQPDLPAAVRALPQNQAGSVSEPMHKGVAEQFARMLSDNPRDMLPPEVQQQIRSAVQEYQGSLESTNNHQKADFIPPDKDTVTPEKLSALLLSLKEVRQGGLKPQAPPEPAAVAWLAGGDEHAMQMLQMPKEDVHQTLPSEPLPKEAKDLPDLQPAEFSMVTGTQGPARPMAVGDPIQTEKPAGTDFVKDNVIRIVDKVATQAADGKYEFDVTLKPEFLGKVSIRLMMENGSIRMQIRTHDLSVKGLFTDQLSGLKSLLKDKGIAVTNIDIEYQSGMSGGYEAYRQNSSHSGAQHSRKHNSSRFDADELAAIGLYGARAAETVQYIGGSSVEYLA